MKKLKKEYKSTFTIMAHRNRLNLLKESLEKLLKPSLFKRISLNDRLIVIKEVADAEARLWDAVFTEYPFLRNKEVSITHSVIKIN